MNNKNDELNTLLTKMGRPTIEQIEARRRWSHRIDWAIILSGGSGLFLALQGIAIGLLFLIGAGIGFVVHSRDREGSFMALLFLMAATTVVLGAVGSVFDIPWLDFGSGAPGRGISGGWEY